MIVVASLPFYEIKKSKIHLRYSKVEFISLFKPQYFERHANSLAVNSCPNNRNPFECICIYCLPVRDSYSLPLDSKYFLPLAYKSDIYTESTLYSFFPVLVIWELNNLISPKSFYPFFAPSDSFFNWLCKYQSSKLLHHIVRHNSSDSCCLHHSGGSINE